MNNDPIEYKSHLCDLMNQVSEDDYKDIVVKYAEWYVSNLQDKELEDHYKPYLGRVIHSAFLVDQIISNMSHLEIRRSYTHSYIVDLLKMKTNELVKEMMDMGYQISFKHSKSERHLYLLVKLTVDGDADNEETVNECDYVFTHDHIIGSEILDYMTDLEGDPPVLYIP